jgi:hypothetical protein
VSETAEEPKVVEITVEEQVFEKVCIKEGYRMLIERESLPVRVAGGFFYVMTRGVAAALDLAWRELHPAQFVVKPKTITKFRTQVQPCAKEQLTWKNIDVQYMKPVSEFVEQARMDVLNEIRLSLMSFFA